jgi:outer membrane immunogenic protein
VNFKGLKMGSSMGASRTLAIAAVAVAICGVAAAADLPARPLYKGPVAAVEDPWTGFYGGLSLGGRWSVSNWTTTSIPSLPVAGAPDPSTQNAAFGSASARFGGYFGFNWHFSPAWVAGIEGDLAWANSSKTVAGIPGTYGPAIAGAELLVPPAFLQASGPGPDSTTVRDRWDDGIRGRIGYLLTPGLMLFATGGASWIRLDATANCVFFSSGGPFCNDPPHPTSETASATRVGWIVGGGLEAALGTHWLLRGEYRFADYGTMSHTYFASSPLGFDTFTADIKLQTHTALVGLAYKF